MRRGAVDSPAPRDRGGIEDLDAARAEHVRPRSGAGEALHEGRASMRAPVVFAGSMPLERYAEIEPVAGARELADARRAAGQAR